MDGELTCEKKVCKCKCGHPTRIEHNCEAEEYSMLVLTFIIMLVRNIDNTSILYRVSSNVYQFLFSYFSI